MIARAVMAALACLGIAVVANAQVADKRMCAAPLAEGVDLGPVLELVPRKWTTGCLRDDGSGGLMETDCPASQAATPGISAAARALRDAAGVARADASAANAAAGRLFDLAASRRRDAEAYERAANYLEGKQ